MERTAPANAPSPAPRRTPPSEALPANAPVTAPVKPPASAIPKLINRHKETIIRAQIKPKEQLAETLRSTLSSLSGFQESTGQEAQEINLTPTNHGKLAIDPWNAPIATSEQERTLIRKRRERRVPTAKIPVSTPETTPHRSVGRHLAARRSSSPLAAAASIHEGSSNHGWMIASGRLWNASASLARSRKRRARRERRGGRKEGVDVVPPRAPPPPPSPPPPPFTKAAPITAG
uniref:Uncharacterized protein n=1 Tax=Oryza brachyantha TaxID=4533 RepID=J3MCP6_ORYBR